jgi:ferritin-like metal-binding protein YciE
MASTATELYVAALVTAHALEQQAAQILQRQLERLENYPGLEARIREHIAESHTQQRRVGDLLQDLGTSNSAMKDFGHGLLSNITAMAHIPAKDEVLRNILANYAFEHYEIATYRTLIAMARAAGADAHIPVLQTCLDEEQAMADWISDHLEDTSLTFIRRETAGEVASR